MDLSSAVPTGRCDVVSDCAACSVITTAPPHRSSGAPTGRNGYPGGKLCSGSPIAEPVLRRLVSASFENASRFERSAPLRFRTRRGPWWAPSRLPVVTRRLTNLASRGEQRVLSPAHDCVGGPAATEGRTSTEAKTSSQDLPLMAVCPSIRDLLFAEHRACWEAALPTLLFPGSAGAYPAVYMKGHVDLRRRTPRVRGRRLPLPAAFAASGACRRSYKAKRYSTRSRSDVKRARR